MTSVLISKIVDHDALGEKIMVPPAIGSFLVEELLMSPGEETGWHTHTKQMVSCIMEGEITLDYGSRGRQVYKAGDVIAEAIKWPHNGKVTSSSPCRIVVFFIGADNNDYDVKSAMK